MLKLRLRKDRKIVISNGEDEIILELISPKESQATIGITAPESFNIGFDGNEFDVLAENSFKNKEVLKKARSCSCYQCCSNFLFEDIKLWTKEEDGKLTAQCPNCEVDSVIPRISSKRLEEMRVYFFQGSMALCP